MVIVIEHHKIGEQNTITELHCAYQFTPLVARAIHQVTGEHPVPVPIRDSNESFQGNHAFFVKGLNLDEACALLRMVTLYGEPPEQIDRDLIAAEVALEKSDQQRDRQQSRVDLTPDRCCCRECIKKQVDLDQREAWE